MLKKFILENWKKFIGASVPNILQIVPITSSLYEYGNDLVLIFVDKSSSPDYVMKIARNPAYNFKLKNEFSSLQSLSKAGVLSSCIPQPHYLGEMNGNTFFVQGGVRGTSLSKVITKYATKELVGLIHKTVETLITINSRKSDKNLKEVYCKEVFPEVLNRYENNLVGYGIDRPLIDELKEACRYFTDLGNNYFLHGDYWQENIMIENENVSGIIDWEFSMPKSNVPTDICWFLINLGYCLHRKKALNSNIMEAFQWAFFSKGEQSDLIVSCYEKYFDGYGLDKSLYSTVMKITLLKMSLRELIAYGKHTNMDLECLEMFKFLIQNENSFCISS